MNIKMNKARLHSAKGLLKSKWANSNKGFFSLILMLLIPCSTNNVYPQELALKAVSWGFLYNVKKGVCQLMQIYIFSPLSLAEESSL